MPRSKAKLHLCVGRRMFSADNLLNNFEIERQKERRRGGGERAGGGEGEGEEEETALSPSLHFLFFSPPLVALVIKCTECCDLL